MLNFVANFLHDMKSLSTIWKHIAVLQNELRLLRQKYEEDTRRYEMLSQRHELERVAREKYHMKRADEDIFVIYDAEK